MSIDSSKAAVSQTGRGRVYLWASVAAFILNFIFVPMFLYPEGPKSHYSPEGTILAAIAGALGCYGFFACPKRPVILKLLAGFVCVLSAVVGVFEVVQFIRFGHPL